ncbi:RING-H2 finger protein ATL28 [Dendrobium catenatum]|uniref:RING-type E3 ubiquitin transferase n=1 Tax=Dendrobium catenatum TaxID=906689 RepID=A0A2I0VPW5_9ASPA|nr:RING-H2 finger protein ATL28 [Dendrobium catenatum]
MEPRNNEARLDPAIISLFPMLRHHKAMKLVEGRRVTECAVCLMDFADNDIVRLLTMCGHVFHPDCINLWLFLNKICPVWHFIFAATAFLYDTHLCSFGPC